MKYYIIAFLLVLLLAGCKKDAAPPDTAVVKDTTIAMVTKPLKKIEDTFPFSKSEKIEVITYQMRFDWDTLTHNRTLGLKSLVEEGKLLIPDERIEGRVFLTENLKKELFTFFYVDSCTGEMTDTTCYEPRNAILFYDNNDKIIAYIEVCLACANSGSSKNLQYNDLCFERVDNLDKIFSKAGIQ